MQMSKHECEKDDLKKKKRYRRVLVSLICAIVVFVLSYLGIIVAQYVEFNQLDQSLIGETVAVDKDALE